MNLSECLSFSGTLFMLFAFVLQMKHEIEEDCILYLTMNAIGASLACVVSYMINYIPFVILEGVWSIISLYGLVCYFKNKK